MTAGFEGLRHVGGKASLEEESVREPLVVDARSVDGVLGVPVGVEDAGQYRAIAETMVGPPGASRTRSGLPLRLTMVGAIEERGRLPGAMALASPSRRLVVIGVAGTDGEVVHVVVEQEAETGDGHSAAVATIDSDGEGGGVSFGVENRDVRGAGVFFECDPGAEGGAGRGVVRIDGCAEASEAVGIEQVRGDIDEGGIANGGPVGKGAAHGLGEMMQKGGREWSIGGKSGVLEHCEDLQEADASGARRRHRPDFATAIGVHEWLVFGAGEGVEVGLADGSAVGDAGSGEQVGGLAVVELLSATRGNAFERGGQLGLSKDFARLKVTTVAEKDAAGFRVAAQHSGPGEHLRTEITDGVALCGQSDGGLEQAAPRQAAFAAVSFGEAFD